ncbi:hypothetical protein ACLBXM_16035 [Xanthobacteraceae bacterium A53D]
MTDALWTQWQDDWRHMEAIARRREWVVAPLTIAPPAGAVRMTLLETRTGLRVPPQLRALLTRYSARVVFGWHIPGHLHALDRENLPTSSANRDAIWDINHIETRAIPNFLGWKKQLAHIDQSEAPNTPQMWEKQFPFYDLVNGDMLTIDMSKPDGPHPVRYFSHELETLHGMALAPDFLTFVTEMSKLGFAGTEWASWGQFGTWDEAAQTFYIKADSEGGKAWLAWLERDPADVAADEPPPAIIAEKPVERALLTAAQKNDLAGVKAALAGGARPDVVWNSEWMMENQAWDQEFATALSHAVRFNNIPMAEALLASGAAINTRRLATADAARVGNLATMEWLIGRGARVNGWKSDRHWPIHNLVYNRRRYVAPTRDELEQRLKAENKRWNDDMQGSEVMRRIFREQLDSHLTRDDFLAMLSALLKAGADPDARWDNKTTMLMWAGAADGALLIKAGADVMARESDGDTPMHRAYTKEKIKLLLDHGADINDVPPKEFAPTGNERRNTPLQTAVLLAGIGDGMARMQAFLDMGADPKVRDSVGRSTLCYCTRVESFKIIAAYGLDPKEPQPGGGTLLHNLFDTTSVRATFPDEVAFLDFLIGLGLDVNATDDAGRTMLHGAAERAGMPADIALLLARGADKTIKDKKGQRPVDLVPKSETEIRKLLA